MEFLESGQSATLLFLLELAGLGHPGDLITLWVTGQGQSIN